MDDKPASIPFNRLEPEDFQPGEQVFVNYSGFNGWWALATVIKRSRTQIQVQFINPEWHKPRWASMWMVRKAADVPASWHEAWLSKTDRILEVMRMRERRYQRRAGRKGTKEV